MGAQPIVKGLLAIFISNLLGGGAQRRTLAIAHTFAARGHKVHLVGVRPDGPLRCELLPCIRLVGIESWLVHLPLVRGVRHLQVGTSMPALARYLRQERPDVLLATVWARRLARTGTRLVLRTSNHPLPGYVDNPYPYMVRSAVFCPLLRLPSQGVLTIVATRLEA